jgi:hypothetical protein
MTLSQILTPSIEKAIQDLFDTVTQIEFPVPRKEFEGIRWLFFLESCKKQSRGIRIK